MSVAVYTKIENNQYHHLMKALEDGAVCPTHCHRYDHTTYCREGRAKLWSESGEVTLSKGDSWVVPAGIAHDVEFEKAGTIVECVHTLRFADGIEVPFSYQLSPREGVALTGLL